jgi:TP901 family phage tail tape measure protein
MPGQVIDRAFVEILPQFTNFANKTKIGVSEALGSVKTETEKAAGGMESRMAGAGSNVTASSKQMSENIKKNVQGAGKEAEGVFSHLKDAGKEAFNAVGGKGIAGLFAVGGIIEFGKKSAETFENTARSALAMQRQMGGSVHDVSAMAGALQLAGLSGDQFSISMRALSKQIIAATPPIAAQEKAQAALAKARQKLSDLETLYAAKANLSASASITLRKAETAVSDAIRLHGANSQQAIKAEQNLADTRTRLAAGAQLSVSQEMKLRDAHNAVIAAQTVLANSTKSTHGAFAALGINVRDAGGHLKPMAELIGEVADKFQTMAPGAQKNAIAIQLFGRSGLQLLPFLNRGSAGIEELKKKAESLGIVIGDKQAAAFKKSIAAQREHTAAMQGLQIQIGAYVLPIMDKLIEFTTTKMIPGIMHLINGVRDVVKWFKSAGDTIDRNKTPIIAVAAVITTLLLPSIISLGVQSAISFARAIGLWIFYSQQAAIGAGRAVAAFVMTNVAGFTAAASAVGSFAVMIGGWVLMGVQALLAAAKVALAWIIAMGPIALVVAAVIGLVYLIVTHWDTIWKYTKLIFGYIWGYFQWIWHMIYTLFTGAINLLVRAGKDIVQGLWNGIKFVWNLLWFWYVTIPTMIIRLFAKALSWLYNAGRDILSGLWNGAKSVWTDLKFWYIGLPIILVNLFSRAGTWLKQKGMDILTGLWDGLKQIWKDITGWFTGLPGAILHALGIHSPPDWAIDAGKHIMTGILKGVVSHAGGALGFMKRWATSAAGSILAGFQGQKVSANVQAEQQYAASLMPMFGWTMGELQSLINLWNGESGWNPQALNASSGAFGIPQSLPANKMASAGSDWSTNPATQIRWGMQYIKDAYGSPSTAWQTWLSRSPHWYGAGLEPTLFSKPTLIGVGDKPETVTITPVGKQQHSAIDYDRLGSAVARALSGMAIRFDKDGLARLVTDSQAMTALRGPRR